MKTQYVIQDFYNKEFISKYDWHDIEHNYGDVPGMDFWMNRDNARLFDSKEEAINYLDAMRKRAHLDLWNITIQIIEVIIL